MVNLSTVVGHDKHPAIKGSLISACETLDMWRIPLFPTSVMHLIFVVCTIASFVYVQHRVYQKHDGMKWGTKAHFKLLASVTLWCICWGLYYLFSTSGLEDSTASHAFAAALMAGGTTLLELNWVGRVFLFDFENGEVWTTEKGVGYKGIRNFAIGSALVVFISTFSAAYLGRVACRDLSGMEYCDFRQYAACNLPNGTAYAQSFNSAWPECAAPAANTERGPVTLTGQLFCSSHEHQEMCQATCCYPDATRNRFESVIEQNDEKAWEASSCHVCETYDMLGSSLNEQTVSGILQLIFAAVFLSTFYISRCRQAEVQHRKQLYNSDLQVPTRNGLRDASAFLMIVKVTNRVCCCTALMSSDTNHVYLAVCRRHVTLSRVCTVGPGRLVAQHRARPKPWWQSA
jgi:hypothetical protein